MKVDPLSTALRELSETKLLLERLVTSSESFDYHGAKHAIKDLQRKMRDLARIESQLRSRKAKREARIPNLHVINFREEAQLELELRKV